VVEKREEEEEEEIGGRGRGEEEGRERGRVTNAHGRWLSYCIHLLSMI